MTENSAAVGEVAAAADRLLDAFSRNDRDAYFDCFAQDATFLFHSAPELLASRKAYEQEWDRWVEDGFRVIGCRTADRRIDQVSDDVAILTHRVHTRLEGVPAELEERETIVFGRQPNGRWLAVHEHLSAISQG